MRCKTNICGDFTEPTVPDYGQCFPYRLKISCERPSLYRNDVEAIVELPCPDGTVGDTVIGIVEIGEVESSVSIADANARALELAQERAESLRAASPCLYLNEEQQCTNTCPEGTIGDPITVTVASGTYSSQISLEAANASALAAACAEATALRLENPCEVPEEAVGSLWGWGINNDWQLGMGSDTSTHYTPSLVGEDDFGIEWTYVTGGFYASFGLKSDGSLWGWGDNSEGQMGQGNPINFFGVYSELFPRRIGTDTWLKVSASRTQVLAIRSDGTLWVWGNNNSHELGLGDQDERLVGVDTWLEVEAAQFYSVAIRSDGTIWCAGKNNHTQCAQGLDEFNVPIVSEVEVWTQEVTMASDWMRIGAADEGAGAMKTDGTIWAWGYWNNTIPVLSGHTPQIISSDTDWDTLGVGYQFFVGKKTDGTLWAMGSNSNGQFGNGTTTSNYSSFTQSVLDNDWDKIVCSTGGTFGLKTDGTLWGCGTNTVGQLGQGGPSTLEANFVQIGPDDLWTGIGTGTGFTFGFRSVLTPPPQPPGTGGVAIGGVFSRIGLYDIHTFETPGDFVVVNGAGVMFDYIVVGPGGGGGGWGGGGGGDVQTFVGVGFADGTYPITIGLGGNAGGGETPGFNGNGSTTFNGTSCPGGGGGGAFTDNGDEVGKNGTSGGGGGVTFPFGPGVAGGTGSPGGTGGTGSYTGPLELSGGGGGGDGGNGSNGASGIGVGTGGIGGLGTASTVSGASMSYGAGGGGGGSVTSGSGGSSGSGGRGAGTGVNEGGPGTTPGSGGGGGLGNSVGGVGARGIVIIRYLT